MKNYLSLKNKSLFKRKTIREDLSFVFSSITSPFELLGRMYVYAPLCAFYLILVSIIFTNKIISQKIASRVLLSSPVTVQKPNSYPVFKKVLGDSTSFVTTDANERSQNIVDISAESSVILDGSSKVILYSKNENLRFSLASTTKIMTALTALDYYNLNDILTIKTEGVEGAVVGFKTGEQFYVKDLLYAMLLPSGNDAALSIAQNFPGGESGFVEKMNEKAKNLFLLSTHFSDPAGLTDEEDYSTAKDLAQLASFAMENPIFSDIVKTKQTTISNVDHTQVYVLRNLNKLLGINGVNGIKTGFTNEAGEVLVTSAMQNGHNFIIVVMKSQDRFSDTKALLSEIINNVTYLSFDNSGQASAKVIKNN